MVKMVVLSNYPQTHWGSGDSGMGYYEYEVGSGQYFEVQVRLLLIMEVEVRQMEAVTTCKVVKTMAQGLYLGETSHYQWMDDGAGGSGYYSDGQGSRHLSCSTS